MKERDLPTLPKTSSLLFIPLSLSLMQICIPWGKHSVEAVGWNIYYYEPWVRWPNRIT